MSRCDRLRDLHDDRRGTSMTEFVITLPIFLTIFVGLVELGQLARASVNASEASKLETFDKFIAVQSADQDFGDLVGSAAVGSGDKVHLHPTTGGGDAAAQLQDHRPRQPTPALQGVVAAYEANTYARLSIHGHLGEVAARLQPVSFSGDYGPSEVTELLKSPEPSMFGDDPNGQVAGFDLVSDRLTTAPADGNCQGLLELVGNHFNQLLSSTGSRPMLAAGIRYGTVTGELETTRKIAGRNVAVSTHWNTLVSPHVFEEGNMQTAMATYIARLVLKTCGRVPYSRLLGISRGGQAIEVFGLSGSDTTDRRLPSVSDGFHLKVPDPYPGGQYEEAGFKPPLMYRGRGLQVDYDQ